MEPFRCPRCGNRDPRKIGYRQGRPYCRACLSFCGETAKGDREVQKGIRLELGYPLSAEQERISHAVLSAVRTGRDVLIHAVTGAGKTELVYAAMEAFLCQRRRVGFATPRKDVVIDLAPRIQSAFPKAEVVSVYGGHQERLEGDILCLTTHQLYRYPEYFDLLVLDEIDAFPFRGDEVLHHFFERSVRGRRILLSATATEDDRRQMKARGGVVLTLLERYHKGKVPVPEVVLAPPLLLPARCLALLSDFMEKGKPTFVFVPSIEGGRKLFRFLSLFLPNGAFVSSREEQRRWDIERFKAGELRYLVTTSILERGVTVKDLQVIVFDASSPIYDKATLIQIAGRVGRKKEAREGKVYYLAEERTEPMNQAVEEIESYGRKRNLSLLHE